jgi:hypothetical protein
MHGGGDVRAQHDGPHATQAVVHFVRQQAQVLLANVGEGTPGAA